MVNKRIRGEEASHRITLDILQEANDLVKDGIMILCTDDSGERLSVLHFNQSTLKFLCAEEKNLCNQSFLISSTISPHKHNEIWDSDLLCDSFWEAAVECLRSGICVKKTMDSACVKGSFFLKLKFSKSVNDPRLVIVRIHGKWHEFPLYEKRLLGMDEQQWLCELIDLTEIHAQALLYDIDESDCYNRFTTPFYCKTYFGGMKADQKWLCKDIGLDWNELKSFADSVAKSIGDTQLHSFQNRVKLLDQDDRVIQLSFRYIDSTDKKTNKTKFISAEEAAKGGYIHRFFIASRDVSAQQKSEDLNRTQKELLDSTSSLLCVCSLCPKNEGHLVYHYLNEAARKDCAKMGVTADITGKSTKDIGFEPQHVSMYFNHINQLKREGAKELTIVFQDPFLDKWLSLTVWKSQNDRYGLLIIDVSEVKKLEGDLLKNKENLEIQVKERTKELEVALSTQSRFLATMSHEIRTPLSGIIASLGHFSDAKELSSQDMDMAQMGKVCSDQLLNVINDILDFSKIEANEVNLDLQPVGLHSVVEESIDVVSLQANAKNLPLVFENVTNDLGLRIEIDRGRTRQILINLLSNATKFTSKGQVLVKTEIITDENGNTMLKVSVKDSGIGIKDSFKSKIFLPFLQSDSTITRTYGGTGLGLSICKRLVNLMGGDIWVDSEEGKGSTFYFTAKTRIIEADNEGQVLRSIQSELKKSQKEFKIGILDHNECRTQSLFTFLKGMDLDCECFPSSQNFLQLENFDSFKLIFLDLERRNEGDIEKLRLKLQRNGGFLVIFGSSIPEKWMGKSVSSLFSLRTPYHLDQILLLLDRLLLGNVKRNLASEIGNSTVIQRMDGFKILVAEDNEFNQKVINMMLKKMGVQVTMVDNGMKAVEAVENGMFDLVLMDCMMPIMGGLEATQLIRSKIPNEKRPKIVALTADSMLDHRQLCFDAGMDDVLTKPVKQEQTL